MSETKRQQNARHARASYQQQRDRRAEKAVAMYQEERPDITVAQIAVRLCVEPKSVYRYLHEAGVVLKKQERRGRPKNLANIRRAHDLRDLGKGNNEIARLMGISPSQVSRYLKLDLEDIDKHTESGE